MRKAEKRKIGAERAARHAEANRLSGLRAQARDREERAKKAKKEEKE